jgi:hypothetical protein
MKPITQISSHQRGSGIFPLTDYSFQPTVEAHGSSSTIPEKKLRAFRKLSSEFFGAETTRDYVAEFLFFTAITAVSAWPVISMFAAVTRLVRHY